MIGSGRDHDRRRAAAQGGPQLPIGKDDEQRAGRFVGAPQGRCKLGSHQRNAVLDQVAAGH